MVIGILLGSFYHPVVLPSLGCVVIAVVAVCLIASSNYVINEYLDASMDRSHPKKRDRPVAAGRISLTAVLLQWLLLATIGLSLAWLINIPYFVTGMLLLMMGLIYNVPPVRTKEIPYLDVLTESVNNPLRLALGWFVVNSQSLPPLTLIVSFWMMGAFFMATKRLAEYRYLNDSVQAAAYRRSFAYYNETRLLVSMFFYATLAALMLGMFIIRYRLELILSTPLVAGLFTWYLALGLKEDSSAQQPEKLYRESGLMLYLFLCVAVFLVLMFVDIPALYRIFNVEPSELPPLWKFSLGH
ncbi:MAG: UbiA family prenyltransferase [Planctomycetes bacterium]|nr:UbiA family prenyltransferase [Planctomycetota bacterium]